MVASVDDTYPAVIHGNAQSRCRSEGRADTAAAPPYRQTKRGWGQPWNEARDRSVLCKQKHMLAAAARVWFLEYYLVRSYNVVCTAMAPTSVTFCVSMA